MISVIISIYKNLENLDLILLGLNDQTYKDFEVIISEDNNSQKTIDFIEEARQRFQFEIKHVSQEDIGFRKTRILNQALLAASHEYLVFLDGDCVPHQKLLESYLKYLNPNTVCLGRRCYLSKSFTQKLYRKRNIKDINILNVILHGRHLDHAFYIKNSKLGNPNRKIVGCNWAVWKQNLIDINGFDEDYIHPGVGEDHDVDWRLRLQNITFLNIKREVIVYHLYHDSNYTQDITDYVNAQKEKKMKEGYIVCKNGINKQEESLS